MTAEKEEEFRNLQWEVYRLKQRIEALLYALQLMQAENRNMQTVIRKDYEFKDGKWVKKLSPDNVSLAS